MDPAVKRENAVCETQATTDPRSFSLLLSGFPATIRPVALSAPRADQPHFCMAAALALLLYSSSRVLFKQYRHKCSINNEGDRSVYAGAR